MSFRWSRSGGRQHDKVSEGDSAEFDCGQRGGVIEVVEFASFGTPLVRRRSAAATSAMVTLAHTTTASEIRERSEIREIPPLEAHPQCHAPSSAEVLTAACVGRQRCSVLATRDAFGMGASEFGKGAPRQLLRGGQAPWWAPRRVVRPAALLGDGALLRW